MFAGDMALALGRTLAGVLALSAAEVAFWKAYRDKRGFPADRIEGGVAISGAAQVRAWGGKVEPKDLLPRFGAQQQSPEVLASRLSSLPGAKVRYIPRPDRKKRAGPKDEPKDEPPAPRRILNPKK